MKILFLTGWYPHPKNPNHGIFVRDQAVALNKHHQVLVVSARIAYESFGVFSFSRQENVYEGVREISITVKKSFPVFNQLNFFLVVIAVTLKAARQFSPDLVHGNIGYPGAFWSWVISKIKRVPYVVTEHTRLGNNFRSAIHKMLTLFGVRRASAVVAVSAWHAAEIEKLTGKEVTVIGNIIQTDRFKKISGKQGGTTIHLGMLGGMDTPVKGFDVALNACAQLNRDYVLHIGGTGKYLHEYEALAGKLGIKHRCIFYGRVAYTEVPDFMARLHFFVSASRSETFGMVMAEAMACGLPVVATNSGGAAELILPENGILVPNEDATELAKAINRMIDTLGGYNAEKIRATVNRFAEPVFIAGIRKVYERILPGRFV